MTLLRSLARASEGKALRSAQREAGAIELELDHPRLGCGRRCYVVLRLGRKWATLLAIARLTKITIARATFDRLAAAAPRLDPRAVARVIRAQLRLFKRLDCLHSPTAARSALKLMEVTHATAPSRQGLHDPRQARRRRGDPAAVRPQAA